MLLTFADQARTMGERLGGDDKEFLEGIATALTCAHSVVSTLPEALDSMVRKAECAAYLGCAELLRERATKIEKGQDAPLRPQSALRQAAEAIERGVKQSRPAPTSQLTKPGFILHA